MKRVSVCISAFVFFSAAFSDNKSGIEPTMYADISEASIDSAVVDSFNGPHGIFGVFFALRKQGATLDGLNDKNKVNYTYNNMKIFGLAAGLGYSKMLKYNILLGIDVFADLSMKKKKEGNWKDLNSDFYEVKKSDTSLTGKILTGKVESGIAIPSIALKCGYVLPKYSSVVFAKAGFSRITSKYTYLANDQKYSEVDAAALVPFLCVGAEKKINKKLGVSLEATLSLKKDAKKAPDSTATHKIRLGRKDIRIMGTYSTAN